MMHRPGLLLSISVLPALPPMAWGLLQGGDLGQGLLTGGLLGLITSFMTGLITHLCYTPRTLTRSLVAIVLTMSLRLLALLLTCITLRSGAPGLYVAAVVTMTSVVVLALLLDGVLLALPDCRGPEEIPRG